jgi:hypothetical protein
MTITIVLAFVTLLSALRAAWLWWRASKGSPKTVAHRTGSEGHVLQMDEEAAVTSLLNAQAVLWSGVTAVLSASTSI